jgi:hypothetical protein
MTTGLRPGLTSTEAARRLREDGPNVVARPRPRPIGGRVTLALAQAAAPSLGTGPST